ncbi:ABC transporter ATP-binding protein [Longimicrobium sp.]|jgi:ABC-2 type transport system ATP-binding protein|uniref:ABC transporter ATP-binding protein n=1 Tax=Longimicrobium sp. TaxID=2029185 RepID=UPI002F954CDA
MIDVQQLRKVYDGRVAVADLSFQVRGGEILGIVGPNGAGKTTTLRAICGIHPPTSGHVSIGGFDVERQAMEAKRRLALIPDEPHLFASLTVWEHLDFTARVYGVREWHPAAERLLAELELADRRDSMADELSRGMRQKVAVACALLHDPAALLLDEPLTGLDPRGIRTLYDTLRRRAAAGAAVVLSSHLLGQIEGLCTSFLILRQGQLLFHGSRDELRERFAGELGPDATLEDIFFHVTEGDAPAAEATG